MSNNKLSRRELLKWMGVSSTAIALAACAPAAGPGASGGEAAPDSAQKALSIATYADPRNEWQRVAAREWAEENPDVALNIDEIIYGEMNKKQLTALATDTLWDVSFSGIKWFPFIVHKGAFASLDDFVAANDPGIDDFFEAGLAGSSFEGQLYGLPYLIHPGNPALVIQNKDLLGEKGIDAQTSDDWTTLDYMEMLAAATDPDNSIYGTNYLPNNYYDFCSLTRSYGGDILDEEGVNFTFNTDPHSVEACQWIVDLRVQHHAAPLREEAQGIQFAAGNLYTATLGTYAVRSLNETIGDKFEWEIVLHPTGPDGIRGYQGFVECFSVSANSEYPQEAYDLIVKETSTEVGVWSVLNSSNQPTARKSVWDAPELSDLHPIFKRGLDWMASYNGPFPTPANLRFQELQDTWANTSKELFFGEMDFEEGMQLVQDECQAIVELERPT
ncbi:extracellular solute-binding protein [Chloroflexi bacterium TSY]|nr:extracellular solute-binding protein [Chloroflexi bacterium TSY]